MSRIWTLLLIALVGCSTATAEPHAAKKAAPKPPIDVREEPEPTPEPSPEPLPPTPIVPPLPILSVPDRVEGQAGAFIPITATTNGQSVTYIAMDTGLSVFPSNMLADPRSTVVTAQDGTYRLIAITCRGDVMSDPKTVMVVVHGAQPPPVPPTPVPVPVPPVPPTPVPPTPVPPVVVTARSLWIVVLDDWTLRTQEVTRILTDTALRQTLLDAGHVYRSFDFSQTKEIAKYSTQLAANGGMPCVVLMQKGGSDDGKWLNKEPADMKLPLTQDGWRILIGKYTGK